MEASTKEASQTPKLYYMTSQQLKTSCVQIFCYTCFMIINYKYELLNMESFVINYIGT